MSEYKYLDKDGLIYYHSKVKNLLGGKVDKETGKGLSANDFTNSFKTKLEGIATGAEVNQNAFSNVVVGETTIAADSKTDTLTLEAGNNITLTPNSTSDKITIAAKDTTYSDATQSTHGLMSTTDKKKLDGIAEGATANVGTITGVSVNGTSVATSGVANITSVPASILSGAIKNGVTATTQTAGDNSTKVATTAFVKTAVDTAIGSITGIEFQIVTSLPATGKTGVIYLISNSGTAPNIYDEYIWIASTSKFEKIGTTDVDLSGYVQDSDMVAITNAEIDAIVAA
jgi:hypothetical protein